MGVRVGIYNFRKPFIKLKFVKSHNECPNTSTLFATSLPLLLYCFFVYLLPTFQKGFFVTVKSVKPCFAVCAYVLFYLLFDTNFSKILSVKSGDIETNPDPRKSSPIKFCYWNLNGLGTHDFIKVPLTEAFLSTHNFDILCLSETFLDSTIDLNNENINIDGYSILRADHPINNKRGGDCMYFKQPSPLIRRDDLSTMQETTVTEILVENETCFLHASIGHKVKVITSVKTSVQN